MRILILMRSSILTNRGGAEVQAEFIRQACVEAGHEVHFAFESKEPIAVPNDGTRYHLLPNRGRIRSYFNYGPLLRLVRQIKPDVIYQRVRFSYTGIGAYLAKRHGFRLIHGISADYACKRNRIQIRRACVSSWITERLGRYGILHADSLISQTAYQADLLRENFGLDSVVIPNGHPVPRGPFEKSAPPVIVWVANIKSWKQPELFIDLAEQMCDTNARFIMAGRPSGAAYQKSILDRALKVPNVEYVGHLSLGEVNDLLAQASVFVNTSRPREGFPNTFVQAWLRETPVASLSFDPDGVNAREGIGFRSGSLERLAADVRKLIESPDLRREMGKRAREYARREHDLRVTTARHLVEFERIASRPRERGK